MLAEVRRVLGTPGMFIASAWANGSSSPMGTVAEILDSYLEAAGGVDEETWSTGQQGAAVLREAGFTNVSVETGSFRAGFIDAEAALSWVTAWPTVATRLARLDPRRREQLLSDARAALAASDLTWTFVFNFYVAHEPRT